MSAVYNEIIEFIARGVTSESVADFEPSQETKEYVFELIRKEKNEGLTSEKSNELDHFMEAEHIMRMAKARAKALLIIPVAAVFDLHSRNAIAGSVR